MAEIHAPINPPKLDFGIQSHVPPALSFGFGYPAIQSHPVLNVPSSSVPLTFSPRATGKRRAEDDEGDDRMSERSPTPEARKRIALKRVKTSPSANPSTHKDSSKAPDNNQSDIGVMLAMLPAQSLMPLLISLVKTRPDLKPLILSLMPRPSLESAIQMLQHAANKLRDAHPYSAPAPLVPRQASSDGRSSVTFGFASINKESSAGMRDSYVQSRIAPHLSEFITTVISSLPFFSHLPTSPLSLTDTGHTHRFAKHQPHPSETFSYLAALTRALLSFPPSTQSALESMLISRLINEWDAWLRRVDEVINKEYGIFGNGTLKNWDHELDLLAQAGTNSVPSLSKLSDLKSEWRTRAGWLLGRSPSQSRMEDEEEL